MVWFFFGPKTARRAIVREGVQEVDVTVRGGYSPSVIRVREGVPLRIVFDRQEGGECTSEVTFPDFRLRRTLPAFARTAVDLLPERTGEFGFACGMNMVHGKLVVEPADGDAAQENGQQVRFGERPIEARRLTHTKECQVWRSRRRRAEARGG
jgi:Cu+-exporting ATPase